jgi:hypothetical protein
VELDLGSLAFTEGGYLLVKRALKAAGPAGEIQVTGVASALLIDSGATTLSALHTCNFM